MRLGTAGGRGHGGDDDENGSGPAAAKKDHVDVPPLDADVLKRCGRLVFDTCSTPMAASESESSEEGSTSCLDESSAVDISYVELIKEQTFDGLYDLMSHDLEKVHHKYAMYRMALYNDLTDWMQHVELHEINRYVFGEGPANQDWDEDVANDLKTVRTWCQRFDDKTQAPNGLMDIYKTTAARNDLQPNDVAMVALAVFSFLAGYDVYVDYDVMHMFCNIEALHEPATFQTVYNAVSRRARTFFKGDNDDDNETYYSEYFDTVAEDPEVVAACQWIFDLLQDERVAEEFASSPFSCDRDDDGDDAEACCDADGTKIPSGSSYATQLRMFYRWVSREIYMHLGSRVTHDDNYLAQRISLLDHHVQQCRTNLSPRAWSKLLDDTYACASRHFEKILVRHDCPPQILETFRSTWDGEIFRGLTIVYVNSRVEYNNSFLGYRDRSESFNSQNSGSHSSDVSQAHTTPM